MCSFPAQSLGWFFRHAFPVLSAPTLPFVTTPSRTNYSLTHNRTPDFGSLGMSNTNDDSGAMPSSPEAGQDSVVDRTVTIEAEDEVISAPFVAGDVMTDIVL